MPLTTAAWHLTADISSNIASYTNIAWQLPACAFYLPSFLSLPSAVTSPPKTPMLCTYSCATYTLSLPSCAHRATFIFISPLGTVAVRASHALAASPSMFCWHIVVGRLVSRNIVSSGSLWRWHSPASVATRHFCRGSYHASCSMCLKCISPVAVPACAPFCCALRGYAVDDLFINGRGVYDSCRSTTARSLAGYRSSAFHDVLPTPTSRARLQRLHIKHRSRTTMHARRCI